MPCLVEILHFVQMSEKFRMTVEKVQDGRAHCNSYLFSPSQSFRNLSMPISVRGWFTIWVNTLYEIWWLYGHRPLQLLIHVLMSYTCSYYFSIYSMYIKYFHNVIYNAYTFIAYIIKPTNKGAYIGCSCLCSK